MNARRWILVAAILLALLIGGVCLALPPLIKAKAQQHARQLGINLSIRSVHPALVGVRLNHVEVSIPDVPSLNLHIDTIVIKPNSISIQGGASSIHADRKQFFGELTQWRTKKRAGPSSKTSTKRRKISIDGMKLDWPDFDGPGSRLQLEDLRVADLSHSRTLTIGKISATHPQGNAKAENLKIGWTENKPLRIEELKARRLQAEWHIKSPARENNSIKKTAKKEVDNNSKTPDEKPNIASDKGNSATQNESSPSSHRDRIAKYAALAWTPLTPEAKIEIEAFEVLLHRGKEEINLGPGLLAVQNKQDVALIELIPRVEKGKKGISFRASIPFGSGPVIVDLVGGPISLSTLGVQNTNLGLVDVAETELTADAHIKLHADGKNISVDGTVRAKNVSLNHERLAKQTVKGLKVAARMHGQAALDGSLFRIDNLLLDVGKVQLRLQGLIDRTRPKMHVDLRFGIPLVSCQDFLDALPQQLIPVVHGMTAVGTLSLKGQIRYDEKSMKDFFLEYAADNDCRITSVPKEVDVGRFRRPFKRNVYDAKGNVVEIDAGPGTTGWVTHGGISRFMEAAVMTCEDGRFRRHRGFDHEAIRNSVRENLKAGKFVRGASTISMQLAKNLYLSRNKTISRKLQELILTTYLEQALTKDQILTLYLNVIEFGPMTYGIGQGASRYFSKHAASLSLSQAMYLASILPNPHRQHFVADGRVSDGWMRYLYKLMKVSAKKGWITDTDLEYGLGEWVVYGSPDPVRVGPDPYELYAIDGQGIEGIGREPSNESFGWENDDMLH